MLQDAIKGVSARFSTPLFSREDHLQEIALLAWRLLKEGKLDPEYSPKGCASYMFRRARDQVWKSRLEHGLSGMRFQRSARELAESLSFWYLFSSGLALEEDANPALTVTHDFDSGMVGEDAREAARRLLNLLQPREAVIIKLHYLEGVSLKDIEKQLGIGESAICALKNRAIKHLTNVVGASCAKRLHNMIQEIVVGE